MEDSRTHDRGHALPPVRPSLQAAAIAAQLPGNRPRFTAPAALALLLAGTSIAQAAVYTPQAPSIDIEIARSLSGIRLTNAAHGIFASSEPDAQGSLRIAVADTRITGTTDAAISLSATNSMA